MSATPPHSSTVQHRKTRTIPTTSNAQQRSFEVFPSINFTSVGIQPAKTRPQPEQRWDEQQSQVKSTSQRRRRGNETFSSLSRVCRGLFRVIIQRSASWKIPCDMEKPSRESPRHNSWNKTSQLVIIRPNDDVSAPVLLIEKLLLLFRCGFSIPSMSSYRVRVLRWWTNVCRLF